MDTPRNQPRLQFPLWKYLIQPLFSPEFKSLNPIRFWHLHNIEQLETCWTQYTPEPDWTQNPVQFLETCWLKTSVGIELVQNLYVVQFLECCWEKEYLQAQDTAHDRYDSPTGQLDESGEYY
ncbi:MAG TPA: hypothetical protein V6C84_15440 [Coleofasciculaceae cyanobacterium]|jgi:hypothetical protein